MVAVQTVTKKEFRSSQTHEFEAFVKIIPAVQAKGMQVASCYEFSKQTELIKSFIHLGLTVVEVAHDFVPKIKNWLITQNIQNSFDTWHGKQLLHFFTHLLLAVI